MEITGSVAYTVSTKKLGHYTCTLPPDVRAHVLAAAIVAEE